MPWVPFAMLTLLVGWQESIQPVTILIEGPSQPGVVYTCWCHLCLVYYRQILHHPQNDKYIRYCIVIGWGLSHWPQVTCIENFVKSGLWFWDMRAYRQTYRHTGCNTLHPYWGWSNERVSAGCIIHRLAFAGLLHSIVCVQMKWWWNCVLCVLL